MKIVVQGLWHLGSVTAACCAQYHEVIGFDFDEPIVSELCHARAPVFEPGLNELIAAGLARKALRFSNSAAECCPSADLLWLCYDTPVNEQDESDTEFVLTNLKKALAHLPGSALVLISSQLPVGTCRVLEQEFPQFDFAYSPENLRLGKAIDAFSNPGRVIVGQRTAARQDLLRTLLAPFTTEIIFMRTESAELLKHALNSFLALSISFINEIARLSERTGADATEIAEGLKSDPRIGPGAYLRPGGPFAGGTLARDVVTLSHVAAEFKEPLPLISAIKQSNDQHRNWSSQQIRTRLGNLRGKTIAVLGLTYKPGTNTLRRSAAVELCRELMDSGATVRAADPLVKSLPAGVANVRLFSNVMEAVTKADAMVVCTDWPEFRRVDWPRVIQAMAGRLVLDANGFLEKELKNIAGVEHVMVGRSRSS